MVKDYRDQLFQFWEDRSILTEVEGLGLEGKHQEEKEGKDSKEPQRAQQGTNSKHRVGAMCGLSVPNKLPHSNRVVRLLFAQ